VAAPISMPQNLLLHMRKCFTSSKLTMHVCSFSLSLRLACGLSPERNYYYKDDSTENGFRCNLTCDQSCVRERRLSTRAQLWCTGRCKNSEPSTIDVEPTCPPITPSPTAATTTVQIISHPEQKTAHAAGVLGAATVGVLVAIFLVVLIAAVMYNVRHRRTTTADSPIHTSSEDGAQCHFSLYCYVRVSIGQYFGLVLQITGVDFV